MSGVSWNKERGADALGRNGLIKTTGMLVTKLKDTVVLEPVTTRNVTGRCYIEVPVEVIPDLTKALQEEADRA